MLNILPLSTLALFSCYICFPGCLTCTQNLHHGIEADDSQMCISWPQPLPWVLPPLSDCLLDISTWWPPRHLKISTAPKQLMTFPLKAIYPSILPQRMALHLSGSTGRVLGVILGKIPSLSTPHSWFFSESCWCWLLKTKAKNSSTSALQSTAAHRSVSQLPSPGQWQQPPTDLHTSTLQFILDAITIMVYFKNVSPPHPPPAMISTAIGINNTNLLNPGEGLPGLCAPLRRHLPPLHPPPQLWPPSCFRVSYVLYFLEPSSTTHTAPLL